MTCKRYSPKPWTQANERWRSRFTRWEEVPSPMRYSECVCGASWATHPESTPATEEEH